MLRCRLCNHKINADTHDRCRSHSPCSKEYRYWGSYCPVCRDLWERARNLLRDPEDAMQAFQLLRQWIEGFVKNSRKRKKGVSVFGSRREEKEYDDLKKMLGLIAEIPSLDVVPPPSPDPPVVSTG